jgi:hypothetical protein
MDFCVPDAVSDNPAMVEKNLQYIFAIFNNLDLQVGD